MGMHALFNLATPTELTSSEPNMFSMVQRQPHAKRRRMFANIYSKSSLQSSEVIRELCQAIFIDRLLPVIDSADDTPLNMLDYSAAVFSDFTTSFVFGLQSGSNFVQEEKARARWQASKRTLIETPWWTPSLPSFLTKLGIISESSQLSAANDGVKDMYLNMLQMAETSSEAEIQNAKWTEPVVYNQLLNQLRFSGEKTYPVPKSNLRLTIASELMDHLVAGTETSGWTLAYIMDELSQRPNLQSSLREELLSLSPPIRYPTDGSTLPSNSAIDALPLLDAIVLETLRLHSPVTGSQPRVTPSQSPTLVLGYLIPPGIRISAQAYSLHRNPEVFPDPQSWKPERWLTSQEKRSEMMRWFWAFGSGANMCLGNHLAMLGGCPPFINTVPSRFPGHQLTRAPELKFAVAALYTNYTTKIIDDKDMERVDGYVSGPKGEKLILRFARAG